MHTKYTSYVVRWSNLLEIPGVREGGAREFCAPEMASLSC